MVVLPEGKTPNAVNDDVQRFCRSLGTDTEPVFICVQPESYALPKECFNNVRRKAEESGGTIQLGWVIWESRPFFMEAEYHAVHAPIDGSTLIDITPQSPPSDRILFLPVMGAVYDFNTPRIIDNVRVPLIADERLYRLLDLCAMRFELFSKFLPVNDRIELSGRDAKEFKMIAAEASELSSQLMSEYAFIDE